MPFTISHAAVVMPFVRPLSRWRALSATVIGAMVPDFGYLLPWNMERVETHSMNSLLTFSLPVGLAGYWLFEFVIKPTTRQVLPDGAYRRSERFALPDPIGSWRQWLLASIAILVAATSHLIWDGFTHDGARGVRMLPVLDDPIVDIAGHPLAGFDLLQHASSALGLAIVVLVVARSLRRTTHRPELHRPLKAPSRHRWMAAYTIAAAAIGTASYFYDRAAAAEIGLGYRVNILGIGALRGLLLSLLLVSAVLQAWLHAKHAD